jgi:hypothetical protein
MSSEARQRRVRGGVHSEHSPLTRFAAAPLSTLSHEGRGEKENQFTFSSA